MLNGGNTIRRIGLLGGSFNPPHLGHLHMAQQARCRLHLNEVWLLVSPQNPLKSEKGMADFHHRFALCEILAKDTPWLKVSDFEARIKSPYTAHTLSILTKNHKNIEFVWLMGMDNMLNFHQWQQWQEIFRQVPIVVFARTEKPWGHNLGLRSPAFTTMRNYRKKPEESIGCPPEWRIMPTPLHAGRATDIRRQLRKKQPPIHLSEAQMASPHLEKGFCSTT